MKIIQTSYKIITPREWFAFAARIIEDAGRTCYKSEDKICEGSDIEFLKKVLSLEHESVIEHFCPTVRFFTDRGVTHELVRHRIASYSQESTRYCNYSKGKFGSEITVLDLATGFQYDMNNPNDVAKYAEWRAAMEDAERHYKRMLELGATPQEARSVLPNSLKTEIVMTTNLREWRHVFRLRTHPKAHPQIREIMIPLCREFKTLVPVIFDKILV